ncbi:MAG: hypothetical protein MUF81_04045 [Verrucomicrobia bacterium]|nr:hypothetical protein [Verrucomicrobiota bacterium]
MGTPPQARGVEDDVLRESEHRTAIDTLGMESGYPSDRSQSSEAGLRRGKQVAVAAPGDTPPAGAFGRVLPGALDWVSR